MEVSGPGSTNVKGSGRDLCVESLPAIVDIQINSPLLMEIIKAEKISLGGKIGTVGKLYIRLNNSLSSDGDTGELNASSTRTDSSIYTVQCVFGVH